jgi:GntR family transcriptional regulator
MEDIKKRAARGELAPGSRLVSVRDFAREIGVNPNTIARVYMELEREGFIVTRRGQGSFVTDDVARIEHERDRFAEDAVRRFADEIEGLGLSGERKERMMEMLKEALAPRPLPRQSRGEG